MPNPVRILPGVSTTGIETKARRRAEAAGRISVELNAKQLREKLRSMEAAGPKAGAKTAAIAGVLAAKWWIALSPRSTNRFARGWELAHNQIAPLAGEPLVQVSAITPPSDDEFRTMIARLTDILEAIDRAIAWREKRSEAMIGSAATQARRKPGTNPRQWKSYKANERKLRKLYQNSKEVEDTLDRVLQAQDEGEAIVLIRGRGSRRYGEERTHRGRRYELRSQLDSARTKVYGGRGKVYLAGDEWLAELHNLEAHASQVDRRTRIASRVRAQVELDVGAKTVRQAYINEITVGVRKLPNLLKLGA
jgi:hypothetical protein